MCRLCRDKIRNTVRMEDTDDEQQPGPSGSTKSTLAKINAMNDIVFPECKLQLTKWPKDRREKYFDEWIEKFRRSFKEECMEYSLPGRAPTASEVEELSVDLKDCRELLQSIRAQVQATESRMEKLRSLAIAPVQSWSREKIMNFFGKSLNNQLYQ